MDATKHGWPSIKHLAFLLPFPSSFSLLPFLSLQFPFLVQFIFLLFLFSPSAYVDTYWLVLVSQISTSFHVRHASNKENVNQD